MTPEDETFNGLTVPITTFIFDMLARLSRPAPSVLAAASTRGVATLSRPFQGIRQSGEVLPNYYDGKFQPTQATVSSDVTDPVGGEIDVRQCSYQALTLSPSTRSTDKPRRPMQDSKCNCRRV